MTSAREATLDLWAEMVDVIKLTLRAEGISPEGIAWIIDYVEPRFMAVDPGEDFPLAEDSTIPWEQREVMRSFKDEKIFSALGQMVETAAALYLALHPHDGGRTSLPRNWLRPAA